MFACAGHVHAYERSHPVYNYTVDLCGSVHITIGDGGNSEGVSFLGPDKKRERERPVLPDRACLLGRALELHSLHSQKCSQETRSFDLFHLPP